MHQPEIGQNAPDFNLPRDGGSTISLSSSRGKPVVIFFYPKDNTSGCTLEAKDFSERIAGFQAAGGVVVGISPDSVKSHDKFIAEHQLSVILAADEEKSTLTAYGVWKEKSMYGRKYMGVERTTFLIDKEGKVARIWNKVSVPGHVEQVLQALKEL